MSGSYERSVARTCLEEEFGGLMCDEEMNEDSNYPGLKEYALCWFGQRDGQ